MAKTTTTRSKTTSTPRKTPSIRTSTSRPAPASDAVEPVVVAEAQPVVAGPELKKAELIAAAVERSGIKKRYAKPAIEAALAELGEALSEGRSLNLAPMGKLKVLRAKDVAGGQVLTARIRQRAQKDEEASESGETPLAEPAE